ncbi:MAG: T9SS type A sorting domain-containing protein, partial [Bacteroidales bacterium]|nr:T9SS type A sorting domain-containing protein [Bacteroidales bacterium]
GSSLPPVLTSAGGVMLVRFTSDGSVTAPGWEANYAASLLFENITEKSSGSKNKMLQGKESGMLNESFNISLFPNPTDGIIQMNCEELYQNDFTIEIHNLEGMVVQIIQVKEFTGNLEIDFSAYSGGIYYLRLFNEDFVDLQKVIYTR